MINLRFYDGPPNPRKKESKRRRFKAEPKEAEKI